LERLLRESKEGSLLAGERRDHGADPDGAIERLRVMKLIRDLVASEYGGYWYTEIIHGSGSPAAEKIQMYREHDLHYCRQLAKDALQGSAAVEGRLEPVAATSSGSGL
jgi:hypothetical protein